MTDIPARQPAEMVGGVLPLIDVADFLAGKPGAAERAAAELRFAYERVGFLYLRGHGVPPDLIDAVYAEAARFHAQPMEQKLAVKANEHNIGYLPMKGSITKSSAVNNNTKPNLNEAFFIRRERTADDPDVIANKRFRGMNQWPAGLPGFRDVVLRYNTTLEDRCKRLVPLYALALGLPADFFAAAFEKPNMTLRMSHYPAVEAFEDNEFSLAPHTDSGFMTLLPPARVPGLSIRLPDGSWFDAPSVPDAYIVNAGDMLHRWTNERFLSTPHRVINRSGGARYAIPYFFDPHPDTMIACLPTCCSAEVPAKHPPILFDDYITWFATRNYLHLQKAPDAAD